MRIIIRLYQSLFFSRLFYLTMATFVLLFVISYWLSFIFILTQLVLIIFFLVVCVDGVLLYINRSAVWAQRNLPERLSNGDGNILYWRLRNQYSFTIFFSLVDEFPESWQIRDFRLNGKLKPGESSEFSYPFRPTSRGEYHFGNMHIFIKSPLRFIVKRQTVPAEVSVKVYPGFLFLKQIEFQAHTADKANKGNKQVRKTGQSQEFEQIREYVSGDDIRSINWKATGRTGGQVMVNNYTDEKSQQIYCIIDKGRTMKMAFNSLTLLDYSVNAALSMSTVAISKQDKAGIISFGDKTGDFLPANHRSTQMSAIVNALYNLKTRFLESDFSFLHTLLKTRVTQRSLLILFTNFESLTSMNRQLSFFRSISRRHLLLVVFFENTSLHSLASGEAGNIEGLYEKIIAEKFILEKKLIVRELQRYGIPALLTKPEDLSVNVINKYLQIKARREI
jgi:uncharacterized protein (DUF58 family)